jgi:hypothetical protein
MSADFIARIVGMVVFAALGIYWEYLSAGDQWQREIMQSSWAYWGYW